MFQRSDTYWRNMLVGAPVSSSANDDHPDIVAEYLEDDDIAEISGLNASKMDSFEMGSVKIELVDADYEKQSNFIDPNEKYDESNKYHDFWKMVYEEEPSYIEPKYNPAKSTASPNDKDTAKEIRTVKKKIRRADPPKIIQQVKPRKIIRDDKLPCVLCNEIFPNRTVLNRHTETEHSCIQCIRCPFTATTRFVILQMYVSSHHIL